MPRHSMSHESNNPDLGQQKGGGWGHPPSAILIEPLSA